MPLWHPHLRHGDDKGPLYRSFAAQYSSQLCAEPPQKTAYFAKAVRNSTEWERGNSTICPELEACWVANVATSGPAPGAAVRHGGGPLVTMFMCSAARPQDATGKAERDLLYALETARRTLSLALAPAVLVFDGLGCKPGVTRKIGHDYVSKIRNIHQTLRGQSSPVSIVLHEFWLFKAEALRRAFMLTPPTPLVYVAEDDSTVDGYVDVPLILNALLSDKFVHDVKFTSFHDLCDPCKYDGSTLSCCRHRDGGTSAHCGQINMGNLPCKPHPESDKLYKVAHFDDRPHLARWSFYQERIFTAIAVNTRQTTEVCGWISRDDPDDWGIWVYGIRGNSSHDVHLVSMGNGSSYGAVTGRNKLEGNVDSLSEGAQPMNVPQVYAHAPPPKVPPPNAEVPPTSDGPKYPLLLKSLGRA